MPLLVWMLCLRELERLLPFFKSSITAKEFWEVQEKMKKTVMKLIQEVDTRWNSTFLMFLHLFQEREAVGTALATLQTDVQPLSSEKYETGTGTGGS